MAEDVRAVHRLEPEVVECQAAEAVQVQRLGPDDLEFVTAQMLPLSLPGGEVRRYRFPRQRASRLSTALQMLDGATAPTDGLELRDWLCGLPGVGLKTASWVVRNQLADERVAVIDIHVRRAGVAAGFFATDWAPSTQYTRLELAFCAVARLAGVPSATLDFVIWDQLQALGRARHALLGTPRPATLSAKSQPQAFGRIAARA